MQNLIAIVILALVLGLAGWYVYRSKKKGQKCIGCPSGNCPYRSSGGCACGQVDEN